MGDGDARVGVDHMSSSGAPQEIGAAALRLLRGDDYAPPPAHNPMLTQVRQWICVTGWYIDSMGREATTGPRRWPAGSPAAGSGSFRHQSRTRRCYGTGTLAGAPFSFTKRTSSFAGSVSLAFRDTAWTSSGDS